MHEREREKNRVGEKEICVKNVRERYRVRKVRKREIVYERERERMNCV